MTDLFLHTHKTGGTTLNTALKWVYGPSNCYVLREDRAMNTDRWFEAVSSDTLRGFDLVSGHFPFGLGSSLQTEHRYFTMLRHPVKRIVSRYYQWRISYPKSNAAKMGLQTFGVQRQSNLQTYMISGADTGEKPSQALQLAKKRLLQDVTAFGITERYDESLVLIKRKMKWPRSPFYVRGKVTKGKRPSIAEIPDSTIEKIRRANAADLELYTFAVKHFEAAYQDELGIDREVDRFQTLNTVVERVAPYPLKIYRFMRNYLTGR